MTGSVSSEHQQLLIAGYVLGDLSPKEAAIFEQMLAGNPDLMREVEQMQRILEMAYVNETPPPAHLKASILSAYELAQTATMPQKSASVISFSSWQKAWGAIAAALIVALGISNYTLWRSLQTASREELPATALTFDLEPTETATVSGSVSLTIDPDSLEGSLSAENLPPLPADQVYALWTVVAPDAVVTADEKNAILTDTFTVDETGELAKTITVPSIFRDRSQVVAVAVTIENAAAPQQHLASPILIEPI
ncbi:anti-sigma factor [Sphaerothrix gracilis]|uniref:anti-sigma factor n=1 Tax=Sphaerothrix gracilis TaxID=3151835 RepID=UPI0031FBAF3C